MSRCEFRVGQRGIVVEASATRSWALPITGNVGQASVTLPYDSPAASASFINPHGGSWLTIQDDIAGPWRGLVTGLVYNALNLTVTASQPWIILSKRYVTSPGTFCNVSAGVIATSALNRALEGLRWLWLGTSSYDGQGPDIQSYAFTGQSCWQVLTNMMDRSDGELHIDADTGRADWVGAYAYATRYSTLLVAGASLQNAQYSVDTTRRIAEATATAGADYYTAREGEVASDGWAAQASVSSALAGTPLRVAAEQLLDSSNNSGTLTGEVGSTYWDIRERAILTVMHPRADFAGKRLTCRVLGRALSDGARVMTLTLQVLPETTVQRVTPPTRARSGALANAPMAQWRTAVQRILDGGSA